MKLSLYLSLFLLPLLTYSQNNTDFDLVYDQGESYLDSSFDSCSNCIDQLKGFQNLNNLQKIKIDILETKAKSQLQSIDTSRLILHKCLETITELYPKNITQKAEILMLLGSINSANSNVHEGIPQLIEALSLLEKSDDKDLRDYCKLRIVEAHRVKKQFKIGFDILYGLLQDDDLSNRNLTSLYNRMAAYYNECKTGVNPFRQVGFNKKDSILKYSDLSLELAEKYHYKSYIAVSYMEKGSQLLKRKATMGTAVLFLNKAVNLYNELAYKADYVNTTNHLTKVWLKKGEFKRAIENGKQLLQDRKSNEYPQIYRKTMQFLSNSYDSIGDYRKSKHWMQQVYLLEKKLFKSYLNKEITAITAKYNYKLKEAELAEEKQRSNLSLTIFLAVLAIIIVLLIIAIVMNRLRKMIFIQKQNLIKNKNIILQNNLITSNKKLTMEALRMVQYDQLLNETSEKLATVEYLKKAELKAYMQEMIQEIRVSKKQEVWEDFERSFREVHVGFYKNLTSDYPNLSAKELRLCAFLKLNLTSKEISAINGTSLRTIETARHRLRKKLNVTEETDLNSFFQQF